jgi:hypothetical protein
MFNILKNLFGTKKEEAKPAQAEAPYKVEAAPAPVPANIAVEGAGLVETVQTAGITTNWPFPMDPKPAEGEKKAKAKKARAPKDASAPKKPRAKKAKQ